MVIRRRPNAGFHMGQTASRILSIPRENANPPLGYPAKRRCHARKDARLVYDTEAICGQVYLVEFCGAKINGSPRSQIRDFNSACETGFLYRLFE